MIQVEEAVAFLEKAVEEYPGNAEFRSQLLNAYVRAGDTKRAMAAYETAIQENPQNAVYRYNYGSMLLRAERYDEAIEQLNVALESDPENIDAEYNLGAAYVNKAVAVNKRIKGLDSKLKLEGKILSRSETENIQHQIEKLARQRTELFRQAVPPLENALRLWRKDSARTTELNEQQICYSLYQTYVQTDQPQKAFAVKDCAGLD